MIKKKIPYGISNFEVLRKKNYLYVDKTKYIKVLEDYAPYQFFIRPRRFGKSLFLSMLESYYDINKKDKFNDLFDDLYIGKNPTEERNQYLVFKISFAGINTSSGEEKLKESFNFKVFSSAQGFILKYKNLLGENEIPDNVNSAEMVIEYIRRITSNINMPVFVLIDEYDNFANELITGGRKNTYESLMHGEGLVKAFYKAIKDATMDNFTRLFMTGVSPIMLDDLTSGFNITENLSLRPDVNDIMGFTENELREIIQSLKIGEFTDEEIVISDMKKYYNGYLFSIKGKNRIYNSDMTLYFLKYLTNDYEYPMHMIDNNVKTDYGRINQLADNFRDESTVQEIISTEEIRTKLVDRFNLATMYSKSENFISLLYYLGMVTIKEPFEDQVVLTIPNYAIRTIYWEQIFERLQKELKINNDRLKECIRKMRLNGEIGNFIEFFKEILSELSNRDLIGMDEKGIKMILMTLFGVDGTYMTISEDENSNGYIDIMLKKKIQFESFTKFQWIIELKYLKESEKDKLEEIMLQGLEQLKRYAKSKKIKEGFKEEEIRKVLIVVVGKKNVYVYNN
ncbi:ATP-binding protein [Clostridium sp. ZS2-4]|uniref:ATP-binding protein n=1 Tax=Clostridium sp. ZS2-4 TaxID=2987703 RepID=UPI00227AF610|nr:ATP-binding protein [Clostridium sp. ZS2-4]MCY6355111.1 AAA family ATPase [Clostridium sp. ZS2-4]